VRLNGLEFNVEISGVGPPLLLLHGFTGSVRAWDGVRAMLAECWRIIALDLVGHGLTASPPDATRYTLDWAARDLAALLDALGLETATVLGYSMGGRVALHFAITTAARVRALVLESASPGIEDPLERSRRAASDNALADRILSGGMPEFVAEWERQPLLALAPHVSAAIRQQQHELRLRNSPVGLANSLRGMGAGQQQPLWSGLGALCETPVQLIVGALDARYTSIGERMHAVLPASELLVVSQAGHTAHLDQPVEFAAAVNKLTQPDSRCYIGSERLF
jgi:2-succinyl-6-hydroxy-2,4-cyclohexadiene-1-carboxylate synthase